MSPSRSPSTTADRPAQLHELVFRAAATHADRVALEIPPGIGRPSRIAWTYGELRAGARRIQRALGLAPGGAESFVAILAPRWNPEVYAAQLGILATGAAFVSLDPALPDEHLRFLLEDCRPRFLLASRDLRERARAIAGTTALLVLEEIGAESSEAEDPDPASIPAEEDRLAYAIYTSGTTGRPKGVLLEHRGIVNLIEADREEFSASPDDRAAQTSSHAFDSSLEETYLPLAAGATLVVLDDEMVRRGPDLLLLLREERITILMPTPTMLRTLGVGDPATELPELRLVYVGGEALPPELCERWAGATWLENGYGPTECTVTVMRGRLHPGEAVHIGKPVRGHRAFVLDPDGRELAPGDVGELCFAGPGLARGYLGRPELSAERFPTHPQLGRIYRSGDLARVLPDGRVTVLGRVDQQVKLRGFRIELEAIESWLARVPGVREAACRVQGAPGREEIAAHLVAAERGVRPSEAELVRALGAELPPYMLPTRFAWTTALPRTIGGKLDRNALPELEAAVRAEVPAALGGDPLERLLLRTAAEVLGGATLGRDEDFFAAGGNSVRAAEWISLLRAAEATASLTVRDVYERRTVARLAAGAREGARGGEPLDPTAVSDTPDAPDPLGMPGPTVPPLTPARGRRIRPRMVTALQAAFLLLELQLLSALAYLGLRVLLPALHTAFGGPALLFALPPLLLVLRLLLAPLTLAVAVAAKRLLVGPCRPGRVPLWTFAWLGHWIVEHLVRALPWELLQGTRLQILVLRTLGAHIGRRVHIGRGVDLLRGGWDLLEIGDDASLGREATLGLAELDRGHLVLAPCTIGAHATVGTRAGLRGGAQLAAHAELLPLSSLAADAQVAPGETWDGVPARPRTIPHAEVAEGAEEPLPRRLAPAWSESFHTLAVLLARVARASVDGALLFVLAAGLAALGGVELDAAFLFLEAPLSDPLAFGFACLAGAAFVLGRVFASALLLRWIPAIPAGRCPRWGPLALLHESRTRLVERAQAWLSGALLWPRWLRLAGARIGPDCEISSLIDTLPEHVEIGTGSFLADGIYFATPEVRHGEIRTAVASLGPRSFVGNHAVIRPGQRLPPELLLGISTPADPAHLTAGSSWFGHPPFELPRREVVTFDRRLTHDPPLFLRLHRWAWELGRFLLPALGVALGVSWFEWVARAEASWNGAAFLLFALPGATLVTLTTPALLVVALKWVLLGRVRPVQHGLWSCWCTRWDFFYVAWGFLARGLLGALESTLLLNAYLRLLGVSIGARVALGRGFAQVVDPDMLRFDDGATVDGLFQAHSFEDRVLKIDRVHLGPDSTLARNAVVLYGARLGAGTRVAPHSVVMKRESLTGGVSYDGAPVTPSRVPGPGVQSR